MSSYDGHEALAQTSSAQLSADSDIKDNSIAVLEGLVAYRREVGQKCGGRALVEMCTSKLKAVAEVL